MRRILKLPIFIQLEYKKHQDSLQDKSSYRNPTMVYKPPERHLNQQRDRGDAPGLTRLSVNNNQIGGNKQYFRSVSDQTNDKSKSEFNSEVNRGWSDSSRVKNPVGDNKEVGRSNEWKSNPSYNKTWGQTNNDQQQQQQQQPRTGWTRTNNNNNVNTNANVNVNADQQKPVETKAEEGPWRRSTFKAEDKAVEDNNNN